MSCQPFDDIREKSHFILPQAVRSQQMRRRQRLREIKPNSPNAEFGEWMAVSCRGKKTLNRKVLDRSNLENNSSRFETLRNADAMESYGKEFHP